MPDGTWVQAQHCKKHATIIALGKAKKIEGALLFRFSGDPFTATHRPKDAHVAISLGNGRTIEARGKAFGVGKFSVKGRKWTHAGLVPGLTYDAKTPPENTLVHTAKIHTVKEDETLFGIAKGWKVSLDALIKANPHAGHPAGNYGKIWPGDKIRHP
jgi:LysM repeat protein